jgi:transcriptional regulator with XRE-family HTH domain
MSFGEVLKAARLERGLSQDALARTARLHRTCISLIERDERSPTLESIVLLARALQITPSELVARHTGIH